MSQIRVYKNLHKNCWSLWSGRVIGHADEVHLSNVTFLVREKSRQRVLMERRKNVHAYVCGQREEISDINLDSLKLIRYNPYLAGYFFTDEGPIYSAKFVVLKNGKIFGDF